MIIGGRAEKLLKRLEAISITFPNRIARIKGKREIPKGGYEKVEVLIFRGFSSCTTHPTSYDPSSSPLPKGTCLLEGEILQGPMNPSEEISITGSCQPQELLDESQWRD